ncbi:MAG TPA: acetyl-coenzyme A synthetase N-terminal domain-containing protein, partial [Actinomycetota bacterium]|nr:acetyl-coenzyme A synthetase N-terminal domain-containing protein [Actinomycetota bacterium]
MAEAEQANTIDALQKEGRSYPPPPEFALQANAKAGIYDRDSDEFWETEARERITWRKDFDTLKEWEPPFAKWFLGGKLNVSENCVDRHVENGLADKVAYHWEGE